MCGFLIRYAPSAGPADGAILRRAACQLDWRGPDGSGEWSDPVFHVVHRRLAVIDLVTGDQPMTSADGREVIAFNGEIYNYVELRKDLAARGHAFRTASDTEVILAAWREWGTAMPERLDGMFAIAIADVPRKRLFLARDRFGEKPLFVHEAAGIVTAGSTLGAVLAALPGFPRRIDPDALGAFLCLNYVPGDGTLIEHVRRLPPGTWRLYEPGGCRGGRFWSVEAGRDPVPRDAREAAEAFAPLYDTAVARVTRSDVPLTLFLSGGIDSALVAESAVRQGRITEAFCLDMKAAGFSELPGARRVAERLGLRLNGVEMTSAALDRFFDVVEHADDPLADSSALALWCLAAAVGGRYKVALSGDGGDELFGGYLTYGASRLHGTVVTRLPMRLRCWLAGCASRVPVSAGKVTTSYKLWRFLRAAAMPTAEAHFTWNGSWLPEEAAGLLADPDAAEKARSCLARLARDHRLCPQPSSSMLQQADIAEYLANDILVKVDRMTMAHGLESRTPFLTPAVAAFALALPDRLRMAGARGGKPVLRALAERRLGPEIAHAPKQGFSIPIHDWLRGRGRPLAEELLSPAALQRVPLIDPQRVRAALDLHMTGRAQRGFELWGLMVLSAWCRARLDTAQSSRAAP